MTNEKSTMTDRERVETLLKREKPDRVPNWPYFNRGFSALYAGATVADAYNNPEVSLAAERKAAQDFGWVFFPEMAYASFGGWEFGGEIKWPDGFSQAPSVSRFPVETEEDVWNLKMPDVKSAGIVPLHIEFHKLSSQERLDNEPFNVASVAGWSFTMAACICGPDKLCKWVLKKPDAAHRLLKLASDYLIAYAQYFKDTFGIDGVLPIGGEPVASNDLISPKMFEEFALPYLKDVQEKVLAMGYQTTHVHICGEQNQNLPHWAKIPFGDPGIISIGHEIELEKAAEYFPKDIIMGNLEPTIILTSTPEEVYEASRKVIEKGKKLPSGFIFGPGCELPPESPPENVMAMTKAVNDFGWYH